MCKNAASKQDDGKKKLLDDPIEIALLYLADASGTTANALKDTHERISEMPFNSDTKVMGTLHKSKNGNFVAAKGSVEHLLEKCRRIIFDETLKELGDDDRKKIIAESEKMAADGLRVLAFAQIGI